MIIDRHGIETDGHIAIAEYKERGMSVTYRVVITHRKYMTFFQLEEKPWGTGIGSITAIQQLTDQVQIYTAAADDKAWQGKFVSFIAKKFGVVSQESGDTAQPNPVLRRLFNQAIQDIALGAGTIKEKVQRIDDFTIDSFLGFRLSDAELAAQLGSTAGTIHGYRKPKTA
jgi:hypothetical protein